MLVRLVIRNLALVEHVELELSPGLNVITGETGAGKSLLIGALSLLMGARGGGDRVRTGAEEAVVEAWLRVPTGSPVEGRLRELGVELSPEGLHARRVVRRKGRGRASLGGVSCSVGVLGEVLQELVDLTGQHEHTRLLRPESHLEVLDAFGGTTELCAAVGAAHARVLELRSEQRALEESRRDRDRRLDYLKFTLEELEQLDPAPGELVRLREERARLRHSDRLRSDLQRAESLLYSGEGAAVELVGRAARDLAGLVGFDGSVAPLADRGTALVGEVEELARGIERWLSRLEVEPHRLDEVEDRMEALERLERKHARGLDEMVALRASLESELEALEHSESTAERLEAELAEAESELFERAERLGAQRRAAVARLEPRIADVLSDLAMAGSEVTIRLDPLEAVGPTGAESAEILLAANRGEEARPIRKAASGGELSRILLAMKQALSARSHVGTYVFDEVDTGIGGEVGSVVGEKLAAVGEEAQVIAVSHLPQVASFADHHLKASKEERAGRTQTRVEVLDRRGALAEVARMLAGELASEATLSVARELRERAERGRRGAQVHALPMSRRRRRRPAVGA